MKFFEFLQKALSEDNNKPSSTRLNVFLVLTQFSFVMTFGFIWVLIKHPDMIIAYLGVLASLVAGLVGLKVWQKDKEQTVDTQPGA